MINNDYYGMACEYMAKTELFDRIMTNSRSPLDKTEAFIKEPYLVKRSYQYSRQLRKSFGDKWHKIHYEIQKHKFYTAQMWVEEYYRLGGNRMFVDGAINGLELILKEATEDKNSVCYVTSEDAAMIQDAIKAVKKYKKIEQLYSDYLEDMNAEKLADRLGEVM